MPLWFAAEAPNITDVCAGCGLQHCSCADAALPVLNALLNAFNLTTLAFNQYIQRDTYEDLPWEQYNMPEPPKAVVTECFGSCLEVLRHMQYAHFCHRVLYWNFRLKCNSMRLHAPATLPPRLHRCLVVPGSNALALSSCQHHRLICLSGHTLLVLRLLMRDPGRRNTCQRELYRTLKRISGEAVAAQMVSIGKPCIHIKVIGKHFKYCMSILVKHSDTVSTVKTKFAAQMSGPQHGHLDHGLCFLFAGKQLQNHLSLAECGVMPNDTIGMEMNPGGTPMHISNPLMQDRSADMEDIYWSYVDVQASDTILNLKIKLWLRMKSVAHMPHWMILYIPAQFPGGQRIHLERCLQDQATVADYFGSRILDGSRMEFIWRLVGQGGFGFSQKALLACQLGPHHPPLAPAVVAAPSPPGSTCH